MSRPVTLFTGQWADLPLEDMCRKASDFGYQGIELEIATERGLQITAPQEWLQLLAGIGIEHVQIRGSQQGDQPNVTNRGTGEPPSCRVCWRPHTRRINCVCPVAHLPRPTARG